jgi:hypothetical protein
MHGAKTTRFSISGNSVWLSVGDQVQPPALPFALDTTPANDKVDSNFIITRKDICRQRNTEDLSCVKHFALAGRVNLQLHGT